MLGLLPPSSRVTGIRFCEAYCMISRPVVVSPVKAILAIRLDEASGLPASTPKPLRRGGAITDAEEIHTDGADIGPTTPPAEPPAPGDAKTWPTAREAIDAMLKHEPIQFGLACKMAGIESQGAATWDEEACQSALDAMEGGAA